MRHLGAILALVLFGGCTADSLRRNTVAQAETYTDIMYQQILENLAMVSQDPETLPAYSVIDYGTMDVSDTMGVSGGLNILPHGAAANGFVDPRLQRNIRGNWTLTPVVAPEKLRALHLAFRFAVFHDPALLIAHDHKVSLGTFCFAHMGSGKVQCVEQKPSSFCYENPPHCRADHLPDCNCDDNHEPGYYFQVSDLLSELPAGWLHCGGKKDVPKCARYTANCGPAYVWVNDADVWALSRFALVTQRIAHGLVGDVYFPKSQPYTFNGLPANVYWNCGSPNNLPQDKVSADITVMVDGYGNVAPQKVRTEGIQTSDQKLKSSLSAQIKSN